MNQFEAPAGSYLVSPGFAQTPEELSTHDGKPVALRTCYEFTGGKWEGFVSMRFVESAA